MARLQPNLHTMVSRWARIQGVLKVKGHVIRALLCWHENRFLSQVNRRNRRIATKVAHHGLQVSAHPGCAQGQGQRSHDTGTCAGTKITSSRRQIAGLRPNLHTMVSRWACIQGVLKVMVKVKGHVIRALLCWHENCFFSQTNGWIATKLAHNDLQVSVHPGCAQGRGHGHVTYMIAQMTVSLLCEYRNSSQFTYR